MVLRMRKQFSLWIEQFQQKRKSSDLQTFRLFAILAGLTLLYVVMMTVVQFSPTRSPLDEIKSAAEAKISP